MSNLHKDKLNVEHLGVFFGTFAPFHIGHYQNVMQAKKETDACLIIVSGYEGDRGDLIGLDLVKRFRYTRELFADDENVRVVMLDETNIPRYPDGWSPWLAEAIELVADVSEKYPPLTTWYIGEKEYADEINDRLPIDNTRLLDRAVLPVSGTMIRENPFKYWNYISRPFRRHFSTNVLVVGTASGGKTTLVKDLARSFGSPFALEYARQYEEESNVRDEELNANDFTYFASGQFDLNRKTIMNPSNNGMFFADTDVVVTQMYSEYYLTEEEHNNLLPVYQMLAEKEKWDLILVIPPVTKYVNDNFRDMSYSDNESRWKMHNRLMELMESYGWSDKIVMLDDMGESDKYYDHEGFYARYKQARTVVKDLMLNKYGIDLDEQPYQ